MTRPGAREVGPFVRHHREELARIWRSLRASARPQVFPGLLDGVMEPFFERCGEVLEAGRPPKDVWHELSGVVRWPPNLAPAELIEEWKLAGEVLAATCESVNAAPAVAAWLERAASACQDGIAEVSSGGRQAAPPGIAIAVLYSPVAPRRIRPEQGHHA